MSKLENCYAIIYASPKRKDALHIASAIAAMADCFITVDKHLLNKSVKEILILNPLSFVERYENGNFTIME